MRGGELIFVIEIYMDHVVIFDKASSIFSAIVSSSRVFLNNRLIVPGDYAFYGDRFYGSNVACYICERRSFGWIWDYDDFYRWILLFRNSRILFVRVFQKVEEKFWKIRLEMGKIVIQIHTRWGAKTMNYWRSYRKREQGIRNSRARGYSNRDFMRHRNFDHHAGTFPRIGQRLDCSLG